MKKKRKTQSYEIVRRRRAKKREWFDSILSTLECIKCGEDHPGCIDFHHRDPSTKIDEISKMWRNLRSNEVILAEIAKCDVLCSNCHRKLHYYERTY